jgi:hypothetical protein
MLDLQEEPFDEIAFVRSHLKFGARVVAVGRKGFDRVKTIGHSDQPFVLHVREADGEVRLYQAKAVIDASGTWLSPNPIGAGGLGGDWRAGSRGTHLLRHPGRSRRRVVALRWQESDGGR